MDSFEEFKKDVLEGLSAPRKFLLSKYFYDDKGSQLFQRIMDLDEYYLTDCELNIFMHQKSEILRLIDQPNGSAFDLIELGAGDGTKTEILLKYFLENDTSFHYFPVDISEESNTRLFRRLKGKLPDLQLTPVSADYFGALKQLITLSTNRKVVFFLGSNIGNFDHEQSLHFFRELASHLTSGDFLIVGFDLVKDPRVILDAYNDKAGVTREFNLNLLRRINRELGANFDLDAFIHYPVYDPEEAAAKSYLMSTQEQSVYIRAIDKTIQFQDWELIFTEISRKYDKKLIDSLAYASGFRVVQNLIDDRGYYTDSLWIKE